MASAFQQLPNSLRRIPRATNSFVCPYATARRRISPSSSQNPFSISTRALHRSNCEPQRYFPYREQPIAPLRSVRQTVARHGTKCFNPVAHQHRGYKTVQEMRSRYKFGPFSVVSVGVFLATGLGMVVYFRSEKERMERLRIVEASKGIGKPKVGGKFELVDQDGKPWKSEEHMKGKFSLVYFGFSHCPDICPEELDKMASMLDLVSEKLPATSSSNPNLLPLFITCDPARDTPSVLKSYLQEFHPSMIGLTGTWEQIKAVCKMYRVYFSTPEGVKPGMDYLVDHSIYFYLMDPEGDFVEAIGRTHSAEKAAKIITEHMSDWKGNIIK